MTAEEISSKVRQILQDYRRRNDYTLEDAQRDMANLMGVHAAQQKPPSSTTAEEIIESILESLGDPINIHNHAFEIRPYTVDHKTEWWIFHKEVASGEPLAQWLSKFAALHVQ